ncbi:unnamed protein product [Amoebophrya sp. A25]|nr:unnamed protein product [Amoebophrya sp. A25]|eukprot:GSA25T00004067001.1
MHSSIAAFPNVQIYKGSVENAILPKASSDKKSSTRTGAAPGIIMSEKIARPLVHGWQWPEYVNLAEDDGNFGDSFRVAFVDMDQDFEDRD